MLIRAPLARANSAIAENTLGGMLSGPVWTTSSSGPSERANWAVGTTIEATVVTRR